MPLHTSHPIPLEQQTSNFAQPLRRQNLSYKENRPLKTLSFSHSSPGLRNTTHKGKKSDVYETPTFPETQPATFHAQTSEEPAQALRNEPSSLFHIRRAAYKQFRISKIPKMTDVEVRTCNRLPSRLRSATNAPPSYANAGGVHFRPGDYNTDAQLEAFLGLTEAQKRERALHVTTDDGKMYYDSIEKEEWTRLLASTSPTINSRRPSSVLSTTSSPGESQARRVSLAGIGFGGIDDKDFFTSCDESAYVSHAPSHVLAASSRITSPMGVSFGHSPSTSQILQLPYLQEGFVPPGKGVPHAAPSSPVRRTRPHRSNSATQRANTVADVLPLHLPSRFSPSKSACSGPYRHSFASRRSAASTLPSNHTQISDRVYDSILSAKEGPRASIRLPAFLGRDQQKATYELLQSAFSVPDPRNGSKVTFKDPFRIEATQQLLTPSNRSQRRTRPAPLHIGPQYAPKSILAPSPAFDREGRGTSRSASQSRPFSMHIPPSQSPSILSTRVDEFSGTHSGGYTGAVSGTPSSSGSGTWGGAHWSPISVAPTLASQYHDGRYCETASDRSRSKCTPEAASAIAARMATRVRRRSSFDFALLRRRSLTFFGAAEDFSSPKDGNLSVSVPPGRPPRSVHRKTPPEQAARAEAVLGLTSATRHLLLPGVLGTGSEVYNGVDIPCPSVHLSSEDEDDEADGKEKGTKKWWRRK